MTWRTERNFLEAEQAMTFADELAAAAEIPEVAYWARISRGRKFAFQPASHLHPTMIVPVLEGGAIVEDEIKSVDREQYRGLVYDLNVEGLHNYVAGGVFVHNCIFGWRNADPNILLEFPKLYPDARVFPLDQNHRSTGVVVALSNAIAAPLKGGRESWTANAPGPRARVFAARDDAEEAQFVATEIHRLLERAQIEHAGQVAVLFRTNAQARALVLALRVAGLPFRVRADADLFAQRDVRDIVAYLRLAHCPTDGPALARVINVPPRRLRSIEQAMRKRPVPVAELPLWAQKRGGPSARRAIEQLMVMLDELHEQTVECRPARAFQIVMARTEYATWLATQKEGPVRLQHLAELESIMSGSPAPDLATWLVDMHLGELDNAAGAGSRAVTLSTIHSAKGAEWPVVFVTGLEDGLLPHLRPAPVGEPTRGEDEERRLAYVAFSRTQVLLYLVYCNVRRVVVDGEASRLERRLPSRFLRALPPNLMESVPGARVA